jgi:tetratricopeptide (TPR) repeat protein
MANVRARIVAIGFGLAFAIGANMSANAQASVPVRKQAPAPPIMPATPAPVPAQKPIAGSPALLPGVDPNEHPSVAGLERGLAYCTEQTRLNPSDAALFYSCVAGIENYGSLPFVAPLDSGWFNIVIEYTTKAIELSGPKSPVAAQYYASRGNSWIKRYHRVGLYGAGGLLNTTGSTDRRDPADIDHAIADFTAAIAIEPYNAQSLSIDVKNGSNQWVVEPLNAYALRADAYYSRFLGDRNGSVDRQMSDLSGAIADYTDAIRVEPQSTTYFYKRADAYAARAPIFVQKNDLAHAVADYQAAVDDYTKSQSVDPHNDVSTGLLIARNGLAAVAVSPGDLASACNRCVADCETKVGRFPACKGVPLSAPQLASRVITPGTTCLHMYQICLNGPPLCDPITGRTASAACAGIVPGIRDFPPTP